MTLKLNDVQQFREQGYVAVPDFYNRLEVSALQAELARLQSRGLLRNVATNGDGKTTSQNYRQSPVMPDVSA